MWWQSFCNTVISFIFDCDLVPLRDNKLKPGTKSKDAKLPESVLECYRESQQLKSQGMIPSLKKKTCWLYLVARVAESRGSLALNLSWSLLFISALSRYDNILMHSLIDLFLISHADCSEKKKTAISTCSKFMWTWVSRWWKGQKVRFTWFMLFFLIQSLCSFFSYFSSQGTFVVTILFYYK